MRCRFTPERPFCWCAEMIVVKQFWAVDMGGSMVIHAFGAYFGLAVSWVLGNPAKGKASPAMTKWSSTGSLIGTIFLWCFWPSLYVSFICVCLLCLRV